VAIRREAIDRLGLPFAEYFIWTDGVEYTSWTQRLGSYAGEEWTARGLRDHPGFLVAANLAVEDRLADATGVAALAALPAAARVAATGAWTREETAHRLVAIARRTLSR